MCCFIFFVYLLASYVVDAIAISNLSGIPALRDLHDPTQTYEGDNYVLLQQLERWLLQSAQG